MFYIAITSFQLPVVNTDCMVQLTVEQWCQRKYNKIATTANNTNNKSKMCVFIE